MKVGLSLSARRRRVSFGYNGGVIKAIERLQKRVTPDNIDDLQAQLRDEIELTPEFIKQLKGLDQRWKNAIVKFAPNELKGRLESILGVK